MGALTGLNVLDLSRILAGPFCTQMLSDLGATVWKVESLRGDDTRHWGPPFVNGESAYFLSANRGKQSLAVNLKDPRGRALVQELADKADVFIANFRAGDLNRYALDYDSLAGRNPRLIYASITGFGVTGPRAKEPGYDAILQGMTGIMSVTGEPEGQPMRVGVAWIDLLTGLNTAIAILAALNERNASGRGQFLDMSLFDVGLASMVNVAQSFLMTGAAPRRLGNAHAQIVPYQSFAASDGWLMLTVGNDEQYRRLTEVIGRGDLWNDPAFRTNASRVQHRDRLVEELEKVFARRTRDEWIAELAAAGIPAGPVFDMPEVFGDPQTEARHLVWQLTHPSVGPLPSVASPFQHMGRTPATPQRPPPRLGEHTREILTNLLKRIPSEVAVLLKDGVVAETRTKDTPVQTDAAITNEGER